MSDMMKLIETELPTATDIVKAIKGAEYRGYMKAVADRPQGEWIPCTKSGLPLTEMGCRDGQKWYGYKCSNCNHIHKGNALIECNFCPNCGADMRKGADDE